MHPRRQSDLRAPLAPILASFLILLMTGCGGPSYHSRDWPDHTLRERGEIAQNGDRVGWWETFHRDGSLASAGLYVDGQRSGRWTYGHPGNIPAGVGHWRDGQRHGWWSRHDSDGTLVEAGLMRTDSPVGPWYRDGDMVMPEPSQHRIDSDTLTWRDGMLRLRWLAGSSHTAAVDATWDGPGEEWHHWYRDVDLH